MGIRYDLSATEILKRLGYKETTGRERLDQLMEEKGIVLPKIYQEFMERAIDNPMLETADIWVWGMVPFVMKPHFFYEEIKEGIEDQKADWEAAPEEYENSDGCHLFYQLPKERWPEKSCDYLVIGSDYGAGVVSFGIRREDLAEEDPPVFMNHEADAITDWQRMYEHLSDYLLEVVLRALAGTDYSTAQEALEELGWNYLDYDEYEMESDDEKGEPLSWEEWQTKTFQESGIDLSRVHKYRGVYEDMWFLCLEEEKGCFYLGKMEDGELELTIIAKEE